MNKPQEYVDFHYHTYLDVIIKGRINVGTALARIEEVQKRFPNLQIKVEYFYVEGGILACNGKVKNLNYEAELKAWEENQNIEKRKAVVKESIDKLNPLELEALERLIGTLFLRE